jgi:hypothetical protein
MGNTICRPTPESVHPLLIQPPDSCPQVSRAICWNESENEKCAENMTDEELVRHLESKLRPVGQTLRRLIPFVQEARARFSCAGRRVPIEGRPSYTEWIHRTLGVSDRHVRRLLAATKEPLDRSPEDDSEYSPKQQKREQTMWQACRIAHAILGLDEADECDPSGRQRKAALTALAHQFLHGARRKPIALIVRIKSLRPADVHGLCRVILACFEMQLDQVFKSLADEERREALSLFTQEIADRYNGVNAAAITVGREHRDFDGEAQKNTV